MKSDQEIINQANAKLALMSEQDKAAYIKRENDGDKIICAQLSRELQADIQIIEGDIHHLNVNGVVMGYNAFADWKKRRKQELLNPQQKVMQRGFF